MDNVWLNAARKLEYRDPEPFLRRLSELEPRVARSNLPDTVKSLRTNSLKEWREAREAAIFCFGMGQRIGATVFLAKSESSDYDFVASWVTDDTRHFAPVQLKEVVSVELNPTSSIQGTIDTLASKYMDSTELTVAIHLNRQQRFEPAELRIPKLQIAALWIFAAISPDESQWALWGNFMEHPEGTRFVYPA